VNIFELLITQPIFNLLVGLYSIIPGGDFGIALIIFTIFVRLLMWPLVKKQIHQVKVMRKIQPQITKIKKVNKGNKQAEALQTMELYKKNGVNPFRTIGVLLVQLPIFIALFQVIRIIATHREDVERFAYSFMEGLPAVKSIIENPDNFNQFFLGFINLTDTAFSSGVNIYLILLALAAAATQFVISKQTMPQTTPTKKFGEIMKEAAEGKQANQSEMNAIVMSKMIKFLPVMMFFIMINLPGALALYYTTSNLVAAFQQKRLLDHDVEEIIETAEKDVKKQNTGKKATAKARSKTAKDAKITKVTAKDSKTKRR